MFTDQQSCRIQVNTAHLMGDSDMPLIEVFSVPQLLDWDRVPDDLALLETIGSFLTSVHEGMSLVIFCVPAN